MKKKLEAGIFKYFKIFSGKRINNENVTYTQWNVVWLYRRNDSLRFCEKWMDLGCITLSEVTQTH